MGLPHGEWQARRYANHFLYWLLTLGCKRQLNQMREVFMTMVFTATSAFSRKTFLNFAVAALLGASAVAAASRATAQAAAPGKYGVVDMQSVILTVEEGKTARANL